MSFPEITSNPPTAPTISPLPQASAKPPTLAGQAGNAVGTIGTAADFATLYTKPRAEAAAQLYNEARRIADQIAINAGQAQILRLPGDVQSTLRFEREFAEGMSGALNVERASAELLDNGLGAISTAANYVEPALNAIDAYQTSDKGFWGGLYDGAVSAGATVLSGANLGLAAFDLATRDGYSNLIEAGGDAIWALGQYASGDPTGVYELSESMRNGEAGWAAQTVAAGTDYVTQTVSGWFD